MSETEKNNASKTDSPLPPADELVVSHHSLTINGRQLDYSVTTGTIVLKEEGEEDDKATGEKAKASIFFVAYTLDGVADPARRPITFSFNGGPGSSSVWLHLGLLGPRRVLLDKEGFAPPPPYQLIDNEFSLLDETDLVFIDPVSTGLSRAVPGEKPKEFHSVKKDVESVGDFIRLYTSRYGRWTSPKFLIGESYGTTRAAGLAGYLQERHGFYLNGIMLISLVLNFQTLHFATGNDLPYILFLPTYAATAWYHEMLDPELQKDLFSLIREVEAFATGPYNLALMKGNALTSEERAAIVTHLARYTGLSADYLERTDLRINIFRFMKELLRNRGLTVGRLDSRFTNADRDSAGELTEFDPSHANTLGVFTATLNDYLRRELGFESDLPYEILANLWEKWGYEDHQNEYLDVAETLRKAMNMNANLKVFVGNGFYDLATPYMAAEYTINHLPLRPELRQNITMAYYAAGHMMYIHQPSLVQMKEDLVKFLRSALPAQA